MGLFSHGKCPIHGIEYSVGTTWEGDYLYCKKCRSQRIKDKKEKELMESRIERLEKRIASMEESKNIDD